MQETYFTTAQKSPTRAVFLDRDGTLNTDFGYVYKWEDWEWIDNAIAGIRRINKLGLSVIIVSNQSGVARGYYSNRQVQILHMRMVEDLKKSGARIDAVLWCPHHEDITGPCECRKPGDQMIRRAASRLNIRLADSWMIGDKKSDIDAGLRAGTRTILISGEYTNQEHDDLIEDCIHCSDLYGAVMAIEAHLNG